MSLHAPLIQMLKKIEFAKLITETKLHPLPQLEPTTNHETTTLPNIRGRGAPQRGAWRPFGGRSEYICLVDIVSVDLILYRLQLIINI